MSPVFSIFCANKDDREKGSVVTWMAVELPMKVAAIFKPLGGMSHTAVFTLLGILSKKLHEKNLTKSYGLTHHSTKYAEFLF